MVFINLILICLNCDITYKQAEANKNGVELEGCSFEKDAINAQCSKINKNEKRVALKDLKIFIKNSSSAILAKELLVSSGDLKGDIFYKNSNNLFAWGFVSKNFEYKNGVFFFKNNKINIGNKILWFQNFSYPKKSNSGIEWDFIKKYSILNIGYKFVFWNFQLGAMIFQGFQKKDKKMEGYIFTNIESFWDVQLRFKHENAKEVFLVANYLLRGEKLSLESDYKYLKCFLKDDKYAIQIGPFIFENSKINSSIVKHQFNLKFLYIGYECKELKLPQLSDINIENINIENINNIYQNVDFNKLKEDLKSSLMENFRINTGIEFKMKQIRNLSFNFKLNFLANIKRLVEVYNQKHKFIDIVIISPTVQLFFSDKFSLDFSCVYTKTSLIAWKIMFDHKFNDGFFAIGLSNHQVKDFQKKGNDFNLELILSWKQIDISLISPNFKGRKDLNFQITFSLFKSLEFCFYIVNNSSKAYCEFLFGIKFKNNDWIVEIVIGTNQFRFKINPNYKTLTKYSNSIANFRNEKMLADAFSK